MLLYDTVYVPTPMAVVHELMAERGPDLVRGAIDALTAGPTLDLVRDLVAEGSQPSAAWPEPVLGESRRHADRILVPLVWAPAPTNPLLWGFDGDLAYAPVASHLTQLTLSGTGEVARVHPAPEATAERVAQFTIRALLEHLAQRFGTA